MTGVVFDIKEFSLHDGPGGRTTVFLKGCPLRCRWCHNPEGLLPKPQLMVKTATCEGCGRCRMPCTHPECRELGRCIHACPHGLIALAGERMEAAELAARLRAQEDILAMNGGGVTVSGGEPLLQSDFVTELCGHLRGMHLALQTSGYADGDTFCRVIDGFDYIMMDIKLADPVRHREYTGVDNGPILANFRRLQESGKEYVIRIPLIPDITDTEANLRAIAAIVGDSPVELLRYNPLAGAKYPMVGMEYTLPGGENAPVDTAWFANARFG